MNHRIYTRLPRTLAVAVPVVAILASAACSTTDTPVVTPAPTTPTQHVTGHAAADKSATIDVEARHKS